MKFRMDETTFPVDGLRYQPDTGWITNADGKRVGSYRASRHNYETVCIKRNRVLSHRIAWRLMTGEWPKRQIDHVDGDHRNNRWSNLREATGGQNVCNRGPTKANRSGKLGVYMDKACSKWRFSVVRNGRRTQGHASHSISAVVASRLIRRVLHGEFSYEARQDRRLHNHATLTHARSVADYYDDRVTPEEAL